MPARFQQTHTTAQSCTSASEQRQTSAFHTSSVSLISAPTAADDLKSPFALLRFSPTWQSSSPPATILNAMEEVKTRAFVSKAPPERESQKKGISRRGISAFWARAAATRLSKTSQTHVATAVVARNSKQRLGESDAARMRRTKSWILAFGDVPHSEQTLLELIRRLCRLSAIKSSSIVNFHSHASFRHLVSSRTYTLVLNCARHNLKLTREIIAEMEERQIPWDQVSLRALLRTQLRRGDTKAVMDVAEYMRMRGWRHETTLNWRRNLGENRRGRGDKYKIWRSSKGLQKQEKIAEENRTLAQEDLGPVDGSRVFTADDWRMSRRLTEVPPDFAQHSPVDIAMLVESLVQDHRGTVALEIAQAWLDAQRTQHSSPLSLKKPLQPDPSHHSLTGAEYAQTAVILLNILLKALYVKDVPTRGVREFILYFIDRHSSDRRINPSAVTLSQLLRANMVTHPRGQFQRACEIVNWFGTTFGLPDRQGVHPYHRLFPPPPTPRHRLSLPIELVGLVDTAQPICHASQRVTAYVLSAAINSHLFAADSNKIIVIRTWWDRVDKSGTGWGGTKLKGTVDKAIEVGVLDATSQWGQRSNFSNHGVKVAETNK